MDTALACFCLRYQTPALSNPPPTFTAAQPCQEQLLPVAFCCRKFRFVLHFQPLKAIFCCVFSVLLRAPPTIYSLTLWSCWTSLLLSVLTPFQSSASFRENQGAISPWLHFADLSHCSMGALGSPQELTGSIYMSCWILGPRACIAARATGKSCGKPCRE